MIAAQIEREVEQWATLGHPALLQRFVLRNGAEMPGRARPKGMRKLADRACFRNSTMAAARYGWRYCEGLASSAALKHCGFVTLHAWNLDDDGNLVDLTWKDPANSLYLGLVIPDAQQRMVEQGTYGLLDTGCGLNHRLMFEIDPDLEAIVKAIRRPEAIEEALRQRDSKHDDRRFSGESITGFGEIGTNA